MGTQLNLPSRRAVMLPGRAAFEREPVLLAHSPPMGDLLQILRRVAPTDVPVLIQGETGCGKELVARAIHAHSAAAAGPWIDINCAALPDHLAESELFGYEKGAFSGADHTKPGLFEMADGGTLFFDEIGELAPQLQSKLLRVLDRMEYFRLGGTRKVRVRTRVIAATNRELAAEVEAGRFRADLYHRLSALLLEVPPLRERKPDIAPLGELFLAAVAPAKKLAPETLAMLEQHHWPGNVRELRNVVLRAAALSAADTISPVDLPAGFQGYAMRGTAPPVSDRWTQAARSVPGDWDLASMERRLMEAALAHTSGHQHRAAALLGISRRTLSRKLREWGSPQPAGIRT